MPRRRLAFGGSSPSTPSFPLPAKIRHMVKPVSLDFDISLTTTDSVSDVNMADWSCDPKPITESGNMETDEESCDSGIDSPESLHLDPNNAEFKIDILKLKSARKDLFRQGAMDVRSTSEDVKSVVEKMESEVDLVGDGTRTHCLPVTLGRHKDLKSVSPQTVCQLLEGHFNDVISGYKIIDCRYPYEYEGGHIKGAVNLHTETQISDFLNREQGRQLSQRTVLIFHCEFSSERGPKMLRHLRRLDRNVNADRYPALYYPEVYLMEGGYKVFYEQHQNSCEPRAYLPMVHESYSSQLRHFRAKSKSWTAGEKQSMRSRQIEISPIRYEF